jgi:hypothetical protein
MRFVALVVAALSLAPAHGFLGSSSSLGAFSSACRLGRCSSVLASRHGVSPVAARGVLGGLRMQFGKQLPKNIKDSVTQVLIRMCTPVLVLLTGCFYVCIHVCMYACMFLCIRVYVYDIHECMHADVRLILTPTHCPPHKRHSTNPLSLSLSLSRSLSLPPSLSFARSFFLSLPLPLAIALSAPPSLACALSRIAAGIDSSGATEPNQPHGR